jgi:hypothetical protein
MERKLASVQRITSLSAIIGADRLEKATVLGWELVVKKGEFKEGQLCIYCEVDSILPDKPEFEFLRDRKFRIKTIKLKGQVSQGICFPTSILSIDKGKFGEGQDVTEWLGVTKYDPQAEYERKEALKRKSIEKNRIKKFMNRFSWYNRMFLDRLPFPSFVRKTDEPRIQLFPRICETEKDTEFYVTEKLDGCSATYFAIKNKRKWQFWKPVIFGVCSRNFQLLKDDGSVYWDVFRKYEIQKWLLERMPLVRNFIVLQGEILSPKIQGNKYGVKENNFYAFDIYFDNYRFDPVEVISSGGLPSVPVLEKGHRLETTIKEQVEYAKGMSVIANIHREGIVVRNIDKNISFKVINPDFLLKYDE